MTLSEKLDRIKAKLLLGLRLTDYEYALWVLYGEKNETRISV